MRRSQEYISQIRAIVHQYFGEDATLLLFGSRVSDHARGGDIDLYVETDLSAEDVVDAKIATQVQLHIVLGDQKIDLVVKRRQSETNLRIYEVAQSTGVPL